MRIEQLREFLDVKVTQFNDPSFITNDPICIPHAYNKKQDIEIAAFVAAILAWAKEKPLSTSVGSFFNLWTMILTVLLSITLRTI